MNMHNRICSVLHISLTNIEDLEAWKTTEWPKSLERLFKNGLNNLPGLIESDFSFLFISKGDTEY